jgi:ferredoxin
MSPWRHGIFTHQSSAGLPYLRSGWRMSSSGIQCRIWPRGLKILEEKVKKPKRVQLGSRVTLDDERCILCSRCIRFCQEIAKDDVLGFTERGGHTILTAHPDSRLKTIIRLIRSIFVRSAR